MMKLYQSKRQCYFERSDISEVEYACSKRNVRCRRCGSRVPKDVNRLRKYSERAVPCPKHNTWINACIIDSYCPFCAGYTIDDNIAYLKEFMKFYQKAKRRLKKEDLKYVEKKMEEQKLIGDI